jgi:hypothetical protein
MGQHGRGVVMAYRSPLENIHGRPIGQPHLEVQAPVTFPLPSVASSFAKPPVWPPPSVDEAHAAMTESAEVTHRMVATLLDRSNGPTAPVTLQALFAGLFEKLGGLRENMDLISELADYRERVVARLTGQRADHLSKAREEHAAAFGRCRTAKDIRDALAMKVNEAASYAQAIAFEPLAAAKTAVANMEGARPARESFPTPEELSAWWQNVEQERSKLAAVQARYNLQTAMVAGLQRELAAAEAEFQRLSKQEEDLTAKAENRPGRMLGVETLAPLQEI